MIQLSAYREDEHWRIDRLQAVAARLGRGWRDPSRKLIALHDCMGTLSVNWLTPPRSEELLAMIKAWEAENEILSNHYVCGLLLIADEDSSSPWGAVDG